MLGLGLIKREVVVPVSEPGIPVRSDYLYPGWADPADDGCALRRLTQADIRWLVIMS